MTTAFRNQRNRFRNYSPPYGDKVLFDHDRPSEGTRPRGGVPSRKNRRVVDFWTPGECAAILLFEAFPEVLSYEERPDRPVLRDGPFLYRYVPHFRVELATGRVVVELSAKGRPTTERQAKVAELARDHYAKEGIRYVELSHRTVRATPRRSDALKLMRYLSVTPNEADLIRVDDVLAEGPATVREIEERVGVSHGRLFSMVRLGAVRVVGSRRIGMSTVLSSATREAGR